MTDAIFALGAVGIGAFVERRWTSARILLQVEGVMLILIAILWSHGDFDTGKPLTWLFAASFLALGIASALYALMERRAAGYAPPPNTIRGSLREPMLTCRIHGRRTCPA